MSKIINSQNGKQVMLVYDLVAEDYISSIAHRLLESMLQMGFKNFIQGEVNDGNSKKFFLPSCALWRNSISPIEAKTALKNAAKLCGATVTTCVAISMLEWAGSSIANARAAQNGSAEPA